MAMVYDITNDTAANEEIMGLGIIRGYETSGGYAFRLSLAAIHYKYGGGKYTFITKYGAVDAAWVSFIMPEPKHSPFNPNVAPYYYLVGGYKYNNLPDAEGEVINPYCGTKDTLLPCMLGSDNWNGTAFTGDTKALLIKEWSI